MVLAATMAFTTASSVACTVASNRRIHSIVGKHSYVHRTFPFQSRTGVRGGERDEDIARPVSGNAAKSPETQRNALGDAFHLIGQ